MRRLFDLTDLLKVINPEPVVIDHQACLRARHRRSGCRACTDRCPDAALEYEEGKLQVDVDKCSRCSLCAGACPTGAVTIFGVEEAKVVGAATLRCSKAGGEGEQLPCLGWLSVDHLIEMGLSHDSVRLVTGDCQACPWHHGGEMAAAALQTASAVLGVLNRRATIQMGQATSTAPGAAPERVLSRRELFSLWTTEGKQVAKTLLPEREVNHAKLPARLPARRSRWIRRVTPESVAQGAPMPAGHWTARVVGEACNGCTICTAFCPTGALAHRQEHEDWILTHQAAACVNCGTCVALCPLRVVGEEELPAEAMVAAKPKEIKRLRSQRCASCRAEFKGDPDAERCPRCEGRQRLLNV